MTAYDPDFGRLPAKGPRGWDASPPVRLWTASFLANLPFPALMGGMVAWGPGLLGMGLGVWVLYAAGRRACRSYPWGVRMVSYGGVLVAALQLLPILQVVAGMLGLATSSLVGQGGDIEGPRRTLTAAGGLIATVVTGTALIAYAGIAGCFIVAIHYAASPSFRATFDGGRVGKPAP